MKYLSVYWTSTMSLVVRRHATRVGFRVLYCEASSALDAGALLYIYGELSRPFGVNIFYLLQAAT